MNISWWIKWFLTFFVACFIFTLVIQIPELDLLLDFYDSWYKAEKLINWVAKSWFSKKRGTIYSLFKKDNSGENYGRWIRLFLTFFVACFILMLLIQMPELDLLLDFYDSWYKAEKLINWVAKSWFSKSR